MAFGTPSANIDEARAVNDRGMQALQRGAYRDAASFFLHATTLDPASTALWNNLATAKRSLGDSEGERSALLNALSCDQHDLVSIIRLAQLEERLGHATEAALRWTALLQIAGDDNDASPALRSVLAHARSFTQAQTASLADAVEDGLADVRRQVPPSERRRAEAALDLLFGRRRVYSNECAGLFIPFLPAEEFFPDAAFPWLGELAESTDAVRREYIKLCETQSDPFEPYVQIERGAPKSKWSALNHSPAWSTFHIWRHGLYDEQAGAHAPHTSALLETLPLARIEGRAPAAFFSVLAAGATIPPHTGVTNARAIVHLPLIVPEDCGFRVGGETRQWREGAPFVFDDTIEHEAWNRSTKPRAILIFDVWNPYLTEGERAVISAFFSIARDMLASTTDLH